MKSHAATEQPGMSLTSKRTGREHGVLFTKLDIDGTIRLR